MTLALPVEAPDALQLFLDTSLDGVVVMGADGKVQEWNRQAEDIFGWSPAEAIGRNMADMIIPPEYRQAHTDGINRFLATGEGPLLRKRVEVTAMRRGGDQFPVELTITPLFMGEWVFVGGLRDLSERKRQEHVREQQKLKAEALHEATTFASEAHTFFEALSHCVQAIGRLTQWPVGHVYLPTEKAPVVLMPSDIWHCHDEAACKVLRDVTATSYFSPGEGLPGMVWESGAPVWIADVITHPDFVRARASQAVGVKSAFGFPIKVSGEIIAILEFFSDVPAEPDPDLMLTLRIIAEQVGRVFERRRAEQALQEEAEALETINRINLSLAAELDLDLLVQAVTDAATQVSSAAFGAFFYNVLNPDGGSYMLYSLSGVPRSAFEEFPMPRNTKVFSATFNAEGIVRSADITKDPRYGQNVPHSGMPQGHLPVRSYLAVPVVSRSGEVTGGLFFGHPEPDRFTQRHENIIAAIAVQAAIGIDNARLYRQAQSEIAERLRAEEHQKLLMAELNHRVKNTLAVVSGIAAQTARTSRSIAAFNENFLARLNSLGRAHTLLTAANWQTTPLHALVQEIVGPHVRGEDGQLSVSGPEFPLEPKPALAMSMILHELVTNAAKYGALSKPDGRITVEWSFLPEEKGARLTWRETGLSDLRTPRKQGFGTRMIDASVRHELGGTVAVTYRGQGVCYEFEFPLRH